MNAPIQFSGQPDSWSRRRAKKAARLARLAPWMKGLVLETGAIVEALQTLLEPGDAVALEGDNQKQADFLSRSLVQVDPAKIHDLHLLISSISRPEHLTLFERGIARKIDLAYAGPQSVRLAQLLDDGKLEIGAIHTYVELYSRMFVDLMPDVALVCAEQADRQGNLYTGPNTEDTPTIVEATAFHDGVVVVQVNEIVEELPRVDIPASWVDVIVAADRPYEVEPLFTRDPRLISEVQILIAMLIIRGIYERHGVTTLNHGIGFDTAAIERQQRQRFLDREKEAFHIDVEDRVIEFLSYRPEGGILRYTGIREHNIELALLPLDLCEQAIKIAKVRHVSSYAGHIVSDLLYRRSQLWITAPCYEDVRAFVHKLLRRRKANAAIATSNECNFSFKLTHRFLLGSHVSLLFAMTSGGLRSASRAASSHQPAAARRQRSPY